MLRDGSWHKMFLGLGYTWLNKRGKKIWLHLATYTITLCSNYANDINSLFALICTVSDTDFIDNEVRFDISRPGVLKFFASLNKFKYSYLYNTAEKLHMYIFFSFFYISRENVQTIFTFTFTGLVNFLVR